MNRLFQIVISMTLLILFSLQVNAHNTKPEVIELEVSATGTLEMKTNSKCPAVGGPQGRPGYPEKGCLRAPKGEALSVEFKLTGNQSIPGVCPAPAKYQLDGVQLGGKNGLKPTLSQWETPTKLLDNEVLADFVADPVSGWVNFETTPSKNIVVVNNNGSKNGYFIWYRVRASCDSGVPNSIYYDPRYDNEGNP